ncbi:winged helix-turn-helix transcriptional regulator [Mycolicibacterium sp. S2-37]|uniref:ArsR/SmtB family transcription factor n=1 Tax=Mycolicibacterium sp. S2-37 TaxID=2810297 RepID=UPI001A941FD9|nr:metalloregulator ArsR/SmtB family transcription factor [Mycolicibacterium sp. S2-37]MBO0678695.1 winged helix-turn-helix transcriptional regulator [Mycolicibacterium sp. S2-37]
MQVTVFEALGEPSRLRIVELLRTGPRSVGEIAETLGIRQPQASKHLRVLSDSGIVAAEALARQRIYHLEPGPIEEIGRWVDSFEHLWEARLDSLGRYLDSLTTEGKTVGSEED